MYVSGEGVSQDLPKAFKLFSKSAEQGNAEGQYNLAVMYENGEGVKANCAEAAKWYSKAAKQNHTYAIDNLLAMYERGYCLKRDDAEIAGLTKQLALMGKADAQLKLGSLYAMG